GLDFITALRPVDYRWDMRDDYRPAPPAAPAPNATEQEHAAYAAALDAWRTASKLGNLRHDGSKTRTRFHHGFIAQEVGALADRGFSFGGYQDHTVKGGEDVLTIGYDEMIAPMVKAIQEQQAIIAPLQARVEEQDRTIAALTARLDALAQPS
ncbi:MAG: hypothetical protein ACR2J8_00275, partial [Thermomicrobiales bacterium]